MNLKGASRQHRAWSDCKCLAFFKTKGKITFRSSSMDYSLPLCIYLSVILMCYSIKKTKEMFVKHVCPPKLKCHYDLDLRPRNPQFNMGHLLVMTNHHTKLEDPWAISSLVIDRTRFIYGPTYRPTDGPTFAKQYTPPSSKGGIMPNYL